MIATILNGLLPVAVVILLGWGSGKFGYLQHADASVLATLVIRFALPLALFEGAIKTAPDQLGNLSFFLCLLIGLMGTFLIAVAVGKIVFKHDLKTTTMQALVSSYPDMAYFGAPILAAMFGPAGFLPVLVGNLITSIFMLPATIVLCHISDKTSAPDEITSVWSVLGRSLLHAIANPIVWVPITGAVLSFCHVSLPNPVMASIDMIGKCAGGVSLFALGLMLFGEKCKFNADVLANLGMKNLLQPALMFGAGALLGLHSTSTHQAIITGAVPTATAAAMFALKNKTYTANATSTILISTLVGIVSEGILIALLPN